MKRLDWRKGKKKKEPGFKPGCQYTCIKLWTRGNFKHVVVAPGKQIKIHKIYKSKDKIEYSFFAPGIVSVFIATEEEMFEYIRPSYE